MTYVPIKKRPTINKYMLANTNWNDKKVCMFKNYLRMDDLPRYEDQVARFDLFLKFRRAGQTENQAITSIFQLEESRETTQIFTT